MKYIYSKLSIALLLFSFLIIPVTAQNNDDNDIDNGVISSAGRQGFSFQTKNKKFLFKPIHFLTINTKKIQKNIKEKCKNLINFNRKKIKTQKT